MYINNIIHVLCLLDSLTSPLCLIASFDGVTPLMIVRDTAAAPGQRETR